MPDDLDSLLDSLFATTPAKFIEERKRVVAALKSAGRKDEAKAVEKIPRPSLPVWTVNQLARRDPELVRRLGGITDRLKVAAGAEYGAAAAELRQVLEDLRGEAAAVLAAAGHDDAGPHLVQRVIANLRAAGGDETRAALERGRLERDVEEQEMTSLFGTLGEPADAATRTPTPAPTKAKSPATATVKAAADAKAEARERAKAIAAAEREVKKRREAAAAAQKSVERAERAVSAAQEALAEAEENLTTERAAGDAAAAAVAQAEASLARLDRT